MSVHDQFISAKETADFLGYTVEYVRNLAKLGRIPAYKRGRAWLFKTKEVQSILVLNQEEETQDGLDI